MLGGLLGRRAKKGNYAYAAARVKARKAFLYPRETYLKLLQMDVPEISRFIGESKYKAEIDELAAKYEGNDLLEYALNLNLARDLSQVLRFCDGELKLILASYLMRWDIGNIKSILRGKFSGATEEQIKETLVPAGSLTLQDLTELLKKPSIPDVVDALSGTIFGKALQPALDDFNKTQTLGKFENNLDKMYYDNLLSLDLPGTNADELFITLIRREVDVTNLRTLFRLKREGLEFDKVQDYMLPGGAKLGMDDLRRLAQAPSYEEFLNMLKEYPYWEEISAAVQKAQETKSLNAVEIALRKILIDYADKLSHVYPLSVCPIISYVIRKSTEVNNLRIIARGKEASLSDEVIKSQLVI